MTLTDNTNTGNTTDALSLSTPQVSGVSVQILRNGIPLHLGPQNGPNSHYLGTISPPPGGGAFSYSIPLQARYKQTGSSVSGGGQANAEALVTINYQ
ncbi:P pilus assembly protein, pilin FimA [Delftia tsuruhatensis]|nr:P pilus assembly protein, pilin FimA [Delftia tsuruhatensis]CAC9676720.1 P pilus assembly protein, pilin FimA [Delftia tsuruhatensis]